MFTQRTGCGILLTLASGLGMNAYGQTVYRIDPVAGSSLIGWPAISGNGQVVAGTDYNGGPLKPARYTIAGGLTILPFTGGYGSGQLTDCNIDGSLATAIFTYIAVGTGQSYRWSPGNNYLPLGLAYPNADIQYAMAMSSDGNTIVGSMRIQGGAVYAYRWRPNTGLVSLGSLAGLNSASRNVSRDGQWIVGDSNSTTTNATEAWRYHPNIGMHGLGFMPGGGPFTTATDVSDDGSVVVGSGSHHPSINVPQKAFRWVASGPTTGTMSAIDFLPGYVRAYANGCTRDGSVVFGQTDTTNPNFIYAGWLWTPETGTRNAATFLTSIGADISQLGNISGLSNVSDDGSVLVGMCQHNNIRKYFMVTGVPCLRPPVVAASVMGGDYCAGETITRQTYAENSYIGNVTFTWKRNGVPLQDGQSSSGSFIVGSQTATLHIYASMPDDTGEYTCTISNPCGSATTEGAAINVYDYPTIAYGPDDTTICQNSGGVLSVAPVFTGPFPPRYHWYRWASGRGGMAWRLINDSVTILGTVYSGANSPVLQISNAQGDAATYYYCVVSSPCYSSTSQIATVTLESGPAYFLIQPSDVTTCSSMAGSMSVAVGPPSNITYQWQREYAPGLWTDVYDGPATWGACGLVSGANTLQLTISPDSALTDSLSATFRCVAQNACSATVSNPVNFTVCPADYNCDGGVDGSDITDYFNDWSNASPNADINCDGGIDGDDSNYFFNNWSEGC